MRDLTAVILVSSIYAEPLFAQDRDASLERINLALQQPPPIVRSVAPLESSSPVKVGFFTFVPPTLRGEMVRVTIPIGELVTQAFRGVAAANQRRQEAAAKRRVEAELKEFARTRSGGF